MEETAFYMIVQAFYVDAKASHIELEHFTFYTDERAHFTRRCKSNLHSSIGERAFYTDANIV